MHAVLIAGAVGTVIAFAVSRRAAHRTGLWRPYAAAYVVAAVAASGPLLVTWYASPAFAPITGGAVVLVVGLLHRDARTHGGPAGLSSLEFVPNDWDPVRWLLLALIVLFPKTTLAVIVFIGLGLLVVAPPWQGLPRAVPVPSFRRVAAREPSPQGVIHYRAWP